MDGLGLIAAERALLSSIWLDGDRVMILRLDARDFVDEFNQWLHRTLKAIVTDGEPLDGVAIARRARSDPKAPDDAVTEAAQLLSEAPTTAHKDYYFKAIRMERARRFVHTVCDSAKAMDLEAPNEPLRTLEWMKERTEEGIKQLSELT
jgi:replicative DNA helicase